MVTKRDFLEMEASLTKREIPSIKLMMMMTTFFFLIKNDYDRYIILSCEELFILFSDDGRGQFDRW